MSEHVYTVEQIADIQLAPHGVAILKCSLCSFRFLRPDTPAGIARIAQVHARSYHQGKEIHLHLDTYTSAIEAMESDDGAPTAPLEEFIAAYYEDDNIWWSIGCGHHMNLMDAAIERIRELEQRVRELQNEAGTG